MTCPKSACKVSDSSRGARQRQSATNRLDSSAPTARTASRSIPNAKGKGRRVRYTRGVCAGASGRSKRRPASERPATDM